MLIWHRRTSHRMRPLALLIGLVALLAAASGCKDATVGGSYKPPFVPIAVSVNDRGELSISFVASIVTPLGTFSLDVTPHLTDVTEDDGVLEIIHFRHGEKVKSLFKVENFAKGETEITVADGSGVRTSGDRKTTTTIEVPRGAQEFTLEAEDAEKVAEPTTTSTSSWSEPPPTTTSPMAGTTSSSEPPSSTESPASSPPST
jgi:hypothetical protein